MKIVKEVKRSEEKWREVMTCDVSPVAMFCILIQAFVTCTYGVHTVGLVLVVSGKKIGDKLYFADFSGAKYYIADNSNNFISIPGLANALSSVTSGFLHSRLVWHLLIQNSHDDDQEHNHLHDHDLHHGPGLANFPSSVLPLQSTLPQWSCPAAWWWFYDNYDDYYDKYDDDCIEGYIVGVKLKFWKA